MSYKEKNLGEAVDQAFVPYEVDPNAIAAQISNQAAEEGIPIQLTMDEMISGNIINSVKYPMLILSHPQHPQNYGKFAMVFITNYRKTKVTLYMFGNSPALNDESLKVFSGEGKTGTWEAVRRGDWGTAVGTVIGSGIASSVKAVKKIGFSLMHSASELEEEKAWYSVVTQILSNYF